MPAFVPDALEAAWAVPSREEAVEYVRHRAVAEVRSWGVALKDPINLELVITELVTNAITHTTGPVVGIELRMHRPGVLAVQVEDSSPVLSSSRPCDEDGDQHGRGLILVDSLTCRWGWTAHAGGKRVHALLDVPPIPHVPSRAERRGRLIETCCLEVGIEPETPALIASELATNAVRHARTPFKVTFVSLEDRPTRLEVQDASLRLPKPRAAEPDDPGGRGFELIEGLAATWHADLHKGDGYKIVCVTLKGDQEDGSGDEHRVHTTPADGQHPTSAGQPDLHRRAFPRAVAAPRSA